MGKKTLKLREPCTCRIFFSSPFGGMEEEREELTRKYFPQIQHACSMHGVQFVAVDMRWGITSQAAEDAQVINICLREVDRSDIFVGFFGQRYGWHGADDELLQKNFDNAVGQYPWLDSVRDKSVTELEFLHGHLNHPGALPACLCFRDKAYDDAQREEALAKGDKKTVFKYSAESEHSLALMADLKQRVQDTEGKSLGVNMAYPHPHEGAKFMFDSIWGYLNELLASQSETQLTPRLQDLAEHDAFRARHTAVYRGGADYMKTLNSYVNNDAGGCVLVTGPAGCGKSALLSNWTAQFESQWSDVLLVYHFIGCAPRTTAPHDILRRLLTEVQHGLGESDVQDDEKKKKEDKQDVQTLQNMLLTALQNATSSHHKRVVIVLDGLNKSLQTGKTSKHLFWLPERFPTGVVFVASSTDADMDTRELLVKGRGYDMLIIKPLDESIQREICVDVLKKSGKELSEEQVKRVVASPSTENPLFLCSVLAELSIFGYFRLLDQKIDSLIYCTDVKELLSKVFTRLEEDYNIKDRSDNLIEDILCAIDLSHNGLSEQELMEIFDIPSHEWMPIYFSMEGLLVSHAGLLRFGFMEISEAVDEKYLHVAETRARVLHKLIGYFSGQLKNLCVWDDFMTPMSKRPVEELPWLQLRADDKDGLSHTLLNIFVLHRLCKEQEYEFLELWKATGWKMQQIRAAYENSLDVTVADLYLYQQDTGDNNTQPPGLALRPLLGNLKAFFSTAGYPVGQIKVLERDVSILENAEGIMAESEREVCLLDARYFLACAYVENNDLDAGERLHTQVMETCRRVLEKTPGDARYIQTLGYTCNGLAVSCLYTKRYEEAEVYFQESIKHHRQVGNEKNVADSLTNLGVVFIESGKPEEAIKYSTEALELYERLFFGHLPLDIGNLLTNIALCHRRLGQLDEAEAMYKRSLEVKAAAVGWDHDVIAKAYMNMGALNMHRNDFTTAEQFVRKALAILEGNGGTLEKTEYRQTTENLISCLANLSRHEEALPIFISLLDAMIKYNDLDRCLPSLHREMVKYLMHVGNNVKAREVTVAHIDNPVTRDPVNYIHLDHMQSLIPEEERTDLEPLYTLDHALTIWPGNPNLTQRKMVCHTVPAGNLDSILKLLADMGENNPNFAASTYEVGADWCAGGQRNDLAAEVMEAGIQKYPDDVNLRTKLLDIYRNLGQHAKAYPHLPAILAAKGNDPAAVIVSGEVAMRAGDYKMAAECWEKVSEMGNPDLAEMAKKALRTLKDALQEEETGNKKQDDTDQLVG